MSKLIVLPFDAVTSVFQRYPLDSIGTYSLTPLNTGGTTGAMTIVSTGGSSQTYTAFSYIQAQQVQSILDNFYLSENSFLDASSLLALQQLVPTIAGVVNTGGLKLPAVGNPVVIFGAGFTPQTTGALQNAAASVTVPIPLTFISPGMLSFNAPDNGVAPWNALDAGDTNNLILTNPNGTTFSSANAPTAFSFGWT